MRIVLIKIFMLSQAVVVHLFNPSTCLTYRLQFIIEGNQGRSLRINLESETEEEAMEKINFLVYSPNLLNFLSCTA